MSFASCISAWMLGVIFSWIEVGAAIVKPESPAHQPPTTSYRHSAILDQQKR
jgi:hypothetical protein